jgi:phage/plasmid-associated DNA primase
MIQEPNKDEGINVGILKELSGNDTYYARDLFQRGKDIREINPMFKIIIICNDLPVIVNADQAVWNRIRVIPFESTFVGQDELPLTYEEQLREKKFPIDECFSEKIPHMLSPFAWILLTHYKKTEGKIGHQPEKVNRATMLYQSRNDVYKQFMMECIVSSENSNLFIVDAYSCYKTWHSASGFAFRPVPKLDFVEKMNKFLDYPTDNGWKNYKLKITTSEAFD